MSGNKEMTLDELQGLHSLSLDKGKVHVDLWYPRIDHSVHTIHIGLMDVRAARDIRINYDFERDGYAITAQKDDAKYEEDWYEVAFVAANSEDE
jgi:hypothetical protein